MEDNVKDLTFKNKRVYNISNRARTCDCWV